MCIVHIYIYIIMNIKLELIKKISKCQFMIPYHFSLSFLFPQRRSHRNCGLGIWSKCCVIWGTLEQILEITQSLFPAWHSVYVCHFLSQYQTENVGRADEGWAPKKPCVSHYNQNYTGWTFLQCWKVRYWRLLISLITATL